MQWKVRRTLASSIHELGIILGEDAAGQDLIPIFNGFLKDLDEVRIGLLKHLADFLKLLKRSDRKEYLPRLSEFLKMDNERNWRFREELANQIGHLVVLFSPAEVKEHLSPIALVLLKDKVSAVRQSSVNVHTIIIKYLLHGYPELCSRGDSPLPAYSSEEGASLARVLLAELVEDLARVDRWTHRQTYALLCHHIFNSLSMDNSQFASDILQNLIDLAWDKVPNVRLVVARALYAINQTAYFTTEANPHIERMEEAILALKDDTDPDVRAYFNPPPSLSTCESTTEYFDSDGEPIGDVSSLPV
jgi:serine/threonine-protein phosphatase 4 regulatory subunit 1